MNILGNIGNAVKGVGKYVGGIAREVRDLPTAYATNATSGYNGGAAVYGDNSPLNKMSSANFSRQLSEVGGALAGKSGTRSDQFNAKTNTYTSPASGTVSRVDTNKGTVTPINRASDNSRVFKAGPVIQPYSRQAQGPYAPAPKRPIIETMP
jgi:hypothetical protein